MDTKRFSHCTRLLFAVILLLLATISNAERLKVGLVLGGGGARGAAHIGVLRELERMRIPVDAIAGTSMGALVGGLYATGMSAAELEELVESIDWVNELADSPQRKDMNFRRKEDDEQYPINFELGLADGELKVPMGIVHGHRLELLLHELTIGVANIGHFDRLPIPFRAMASDIESGEPYVVDSGDLAMAMRASMSVPGVLAPVTIDGHVLVDGGVVANLPIDVMREMDVDVIIAVDVEFPLYAAEELDSAIKVSEQVLTMLIRKETRRQIGALTDADILIRPELGTFASSDFGNIKSAVKPGAEATLAAAERLRGLAIDERSYSVYAARRSASRPANEPLAFVRIVHDGRLSDRALESRIRVEAGDPVDTRRMAADVDRLYGLGLYEHVGYELVEENGESGVEYRATTKSWGTNQMRFGLSLEEGFEGSTAFNLNARLTRVGLNSRGAEWRTDLQIGTDSAVFSEFYQPFTAGGHWFLAPRVDADVSGLGVFESEDELARLRIAEAEAGLDVGRRIGYSGEWRLGVYRGTGEMRVKVGDPALPKTEFDTGGLAAQIRFDTLDNAHFPRRGVRADLRWRSERTAFGADSNFDTFEGDFASTWSNGKNSWQVGLTYATTSDGDRALQDLFPLGGFLRLSALERGAISGPHAALARLVYYRRAGESAGVFDVPIYLGASLEAGNVWQSRDDMSFGSALINGSVFAGFDTYIGPIYMGAGFGEDGRSNFYLIVGPARR
ncbi:MAG: patatin-like phospholipase family protein [Woeseiaceae bacterium]